MTRTRDSRGHAAWGSRFAGATLVEILIAMAVLMVLLALSVVSIKKYIEFGKEVTCLGNVRSLIMAYRVWIADNGGSVPSGKLKDVSINYTKALIPTYLPKELRCPLAPKEWLAKSTGFRYSYNDYIRQCYPSVTGFPVPSSRVVIVAETPSFANGFWSPSQLNQAMIGSADRPPQAHSGGLNLGFADGHAELVKPTANDWWEPPTYGDKNGGLYYHGNHFLDMEKGRY